MDFGNVLKRAWEIIWKFKVLWIFGILASCGQASGTSGGNSGVRYSGEGSNISPQIEQWFASLSPGLVALLIVVAIIIVLILVVIAILLGTVGRVGLIRGTMKADQGAQRLTFGELWKEGLVYFWRVFGLNLLIFVLLAGAIVVLSIIGIVLTVGTLGIFAICMLPLICLIIPVMWAIYVIIEQANIALVVENLSITEAIKRGWQVVLDNIGSMIVMSLILIIGISLIGGAVIGLPLLAVAAPAISGVAVGTAVSIRNGLVATGVLFLIYLPFLLLLSGILRAYTSSAWTLTFLRLTHKPVPTMPPTPIIPASPEIPQSPAPPEAPLPPSA